MKKIYILIAVIMGFVFAANTYVFAETSVDIDKLKEQIKKELKAERPWNKDMQDWGVDVHGFVSQGYIHSDDNNWRANNSSEGTFGYNEIGINFSKQLTDKLRIGLQLFSHDLGAIGNNEVLLDWAFADYRWKDWLGMRVGKIKAPFGLYNESRDIDMLRTSIFLPQGIYNENFRDILASIAGIGVYGDVSIAAAGGLSYYFLAGTTDLSGEDDNGVVRSFNGLLIVEVTGDSDFEDMYIGCLEWQAPIEDLSFVDALRLRISYWLTELTIPCVVTAAGAVALAPLPQGTALDYEFDMYSRTVYSIEYTWQDLIVAAEYGKTRYEWHIEVPSLGMSIMDDSRSKSHAYYISATYRFNDWFEMGTYYSKNYSNSDDKDGSGSTPKYAAWQKDYALSLRFDVNQYWVAKLEGHLMDGVAQCLAMDNDSYEDDWWVFAAKMTFSF